MIVYHDTNTITRLNISRFTYSTYNAIGVNLLKYQNDSSVVVRLLQVASNILSQSLKNLKYGVRFDYNRIGCNNIDAVNIYSILSIYPHAAVNDILQINALYGYSRFTDTLYKLKGIKTQEEFSRYSYPCDIFASDKIDSINTTVQEIILKQNVDNKINTIVNNSRVTISLEQGFNISNIESLEYPVIITIEGYDIANRKIREDITVDEFIDYVSYNQYSFIRNIKSRSHENSITINLYPYIRGNMIVWDDEIVDREYSDSYKTIVNLDSENKNLLFSKKLGDLVDYPDTYDIVNVVKLNMEDDESIYSYFIDSDDELVYVLSSQLNLYCFPLIIPIKYNNLIDSIKTSFQSAKIQYINDEVDEKYTFFINPSSKVNGIELMNVSINDQLYRADILLDLYREGLEDNRIEIPYSDMFADGDEAIIRFDTSGDQASSMAFFVYKKILYPLYIKDLSSIVQYKIDASETYPDTQFLPVYKYSTCSKYKDPLFYLPSENSILYKLSNIKDIFIDNFRMRNVYNTYYVDANNNYIITSDTITEINQDTNLLTDNSDDSMVAGEYISGSIF